MGVQANQRISEEKGLLPPFSGFPRCSSGPPEKGEKGRKQAKKADFSRFPGREARHPLTPICYTTICDSQIVFRKSQVLSEVRVNLLGRVPTQNTSFCESKVRIVQKILGKASDDFLLLKGFFGPPIEGVFLRREALGGHRRQKHAFRRVRPPLRVPLSISSRMAPE